MTEFERQTDAGLAAALSAPGPRLEQRIAAKPSARSIIVDRPYYYATGMERTVIGVASLSILLALFGLVFTVLFTGGWIFGIRNLRREWQASRLRRLKGLPKPRFALTDDKARSWFEANPSGIAITRENFPDSTLPFPGEANY